MYSTRTATVTVSYTDTLTEGGRRESGSTCIVHVLPQLLSYMNTLTEGVMHIVCGYSVT